MMTTFLFDNQDPGTGPGDPAATQSYLWLDHDRFSMVGVRIVSGMAALWGSGALTGTGVRGTTMAVREGDLQVRRFLEAAGAPDVQALGRRLAGRVSHRFEITQARADWPRFPWVLDRYRDRRAVVVTPRTAAQAALRHPVTFQAAGFEIQVQDQSRSIPTDAVLRCRQSGILGGMSIAALAGYCPWQPKYEVPFTPLWTTEQLSDKRFSLVMVGAGALGCEIAVNLALQFPGPVRATIIDPDRFEDHQWRYWPVRLLSELRGDKAGRVAEMLQRLAPSWDVTALTEAVTAQNVDRLIPSHADLVVTAPDSDVCRRVVARHCTARLAGGALQAHCICGARHFGGECYVESTDTTPANEVLSLDQRADVEGQLGVDPTVGCGVAELGGQTLVSNMVTGGLAAAELAAILAHGAQYASGLLWRYHLQGNHVGTTGPFRRPPCTGTRRAVPPQ